MLARPRLAIVLLVMSSICVADPPAQAQVPYRIVAPDRDGIGKVYMGRQISHVMGHQGASWLERGSRRTEERTDLLIANLPLEPDFVVADIGAGTGYFSLPIAARVPQGRVLAVDIQPEMLEIISSRIVQSGIANVEPVLGGIDSPNLAASSIDLAFIVDAYHEFSHPFEMGQGLFEALKPGGQLVLIEYRGEDASVPIKRLHKMTAQQAGKEIRALGFRGPDVLDVLPQQHILIFTKPSG
jgi:ubiquinone/menaquinone biosynthesis C-methylase UbiE